MRNFVILIKFSNVIDSRSAQFLLSYELVVSMAVWNHSSNPISPCGLYLDFSRLVSKCEDFRHLPKYEPECAVDYSFFMLFYL